MARGNGEGSIYPVEDKNGRIKGYRGAYFVYTAEDPKRRYLSGKRREDVRDKLAKVLSDRADGLVFDAGALTVGEYLDRWLKDVKDTVRLSTFERYEYAIRPHIKPTLGQIRLKDLTPANVRWFYRDKLDDAGLAPATVHKLHVASSTKRSLRPSETGSYRATQQPGSSCRGSRERRSTP